MLIIIMLTLAGRSLFKSLNFVKSDGLKEYFVFHKAKYFLQTIHSLTELDFGTRQKQTHQLANPKPYYLISWDWEVSQDF